LWWYDSAGRVRYGPQPRDRRPGVDPALVVEDMLQSPEPWAFIAAHTPSRTARENALAHEALGQEPVAKGYRVFSATGYYTRPGRTRLEREPSYLALGLDAGQAAALGRRYHQQTVLTHRGMLNLEHGSVDRLSRWRVVAGDLPLDRPQTVVHVNG
jgi:hypothetical protein